MTKIAIETQAGDVVVVDGVTVTDAGDAPAPPPPPEENEDNHFGDWLDSDWSHSLKAPDQTYFSNRMLAHAAGETEGVVIPNDTWFDGKNYSMGCGGPHAAQNVRIKLGGDTIVKDYLTDGGSIQFTITAAMLGQSLSFKFIDGHEATNLQHFVS